VTLLAIWLGKLVSMALRVAGRSGSALPGLIVERVFPRFLARALAGLPQGVVVISGTNGKTTTTKMAAALLAPHYRVLTNHTGSNLLRGVIGATIAAATWGGKLRYDVAVFELDELWAVRFAAQVTPRRALLLNVVRDQLDRFGEIDTTARALGQVAAATSGHVVLNRDDPRIAALAAVATAPVTYFGVAAHLRPRFPTDEELYGAKVDISLVPANAELLALPSAADGLTTLRLGTATPGDDGTRQVQLRAPGAHNAQNAAAAGALAATFGLTADQIAAGLAQVEPAFGRGQWFEIDGRRVLLGLVKNPAGFRQMLRTLDDIVAPHAILIAVNDAIADGRDISWLWDVDFARLAGGGEEGIRTTGIRTTGSRAADMALRLHYDEVPVGEVDPDPARALDSALAATPAGAAIVVFATYTAMWALHGMLTAKAGGAQ
jgi:UDP-N-acetylmuramyl tripeptide synthase